MKAISYLNLLTAVLFLLAGGFAGAQVAPAKTKQACESECAKSLETKREAIDSCVKNKTRTPGAGLVAMDAVDAQRACLIAEIEICKLGCSGLESSETNTATCKAAFDDWKKVAPERDKACKAFTSAKRTTDQACEDKVKACKKEVDKIAKLVTPDASGSSSEDRGKIVDVVRLLAQSQGYAATGTQMSGATVGVSPDTANCVNFSNAATDKKNEAVEKKIDKIDDEIKKLKDKIAERKKKSSEEDTKLREENNKIDEDIEKLKKELADDKLKIDEKKRKSWEAANKQAQDAASNIRNLNAVIIKRKGDLEKLKFENSVNMLEFAEGKVKDRCEQAMQIARDCFQKASRGEKFGEKDQCNGFSGPGRGLKGTANLNKKMKQVETACFEQADLASRRARFSYSQQVADMERDIAEKMAQVGDANRAATQARESYEKITKENQTEIANADQSASQREANFKKKLADVELSVKESKALFDQENKEFELQIQELIARKLPGALKIVPNSNGDDVRLMYSEAESVISDGNKKRDIAAAACKCDVADPSMASYCTPLKKDAPKDASGSKAPGSDR